LKRILEPDFAEICFQRTLECRVQRRKQGSAESREGNRPINVVAGGFSSALCTLHSALKRDAIVILFLLDGKPFHPLNYKLLKLKGIVLRRERV
jgi:hypothetical protein